MSLKENLNKELKTFKITIYGCIIIGVICFVFPFILLPFRNNEYISQLDLTMLVGIGGGLFVAGSLFISPFKSLKKLVDKLKEE